MDIWIPAFAGITNSTCLFHVEHWRYPAQIVILSLFSNAKARK